MIQHGENLRLRMSDQEFQDYLDAQEQFQREQTRSESRLWSRSSDGLNGRGNAGLKHRSERSHDDEGCGDCACNGRHRFIPRNAEASDRPVKIHGVYLGQAVQDYLANAPGKARFAKFDIRDCSRATKKKMKDGPSDRELCELFNKAAGGQKITIKLVYDLPVTVTFEGGVVTEFVDLVFPPISTDPAQPVVTSPWEKVLFDLKNKVGEPGDTTPVTMQNGFGAKFSYAAAFWSLSDRQGKFYLYARESSISGNNLLKDVVIKLSRNGAVEHQRELENQPSTIE